MVTTQLAGNVVLVLEDDFYIADDTDNALRDAGAEVDGPWADAAHAVAMVDHRKPDCAVVDINLGDGANFAPTRALLARGVPVVLLTGYGSEALPQDLANVPLLQKPIAASLLIDAVSAAMAHKKAA